MKGAPLFVILFATVHLLAGSQQDQTPANLLSVAREQSDIFYDAPQPFLLEADLTLQLAAPAQGHLTDQWQSKNHWRRELQFGPYKETVVRVGEWEYAKRNASFAPVRALQVVHLLEFARQETQFAAKSQKTQKRDGVMLTCVDLESKELKQQHEICADSATHEIVSYEPWNFFTQSGRAEFSSYAGIDVMRFPKHLELRIGKAPAVTVNVTKLEEKAPDASALTPPPDATERRYCEGMTAPVMVKRPDIFNLGGYAGDVHVELQVTILIDGSVGAIQVIGQNSAEAGDRIRKRWMDAKYKPAMCGTEPVVADVQEGLNITHSPLY